MTRNLLWLVVFTFVSLPGWGAAGELDCSGALELVLDGPQVGGNPNNFPSNVSGGEYGCPGASGGSEVVYTLQTPAGIGRLVRIVLLGPDPDHVANLDLRLLASCDEQDCVDWSGTGSSSVEIIETCLKPDRTYYVVVDGSVAYGGWVYARTISPCFRGSIPSSERLKGRSTLETWGTVKQLFR